MFRKSEPKFVKYNLFKNKGVDGCKEVCLIVSKKSNDLQEILAVYLLAPLPKCEEYF